MTEENSRPCSLRIPFPTHQKMESKVVIDGQPVISPMTELAITFKQSCKSYSSTPRRRLSLSDIQNTPTPVKSLSKTESVESGIYMDFSNDVVDSPTLNDIRARSRKNSCQEFSLRKKAVFRRCNSMQATSSYAEPLAFRLGDDDGSPMNKPSCSSHEDKDIALEMNAVGLPDKLSSLSHTKNPKANRSISAPPILDSVENYFLDLDENSNSPTESDGFDFIEEDQNSNEVSIPTGISTLLDGEILNKGFDLKKPMKKKSKEDKENCFSLTDKENIIPENKPVEDQFKRPTQFIKKIQKRSVSFSVKRTDSQIDFSPVSSKRTKVRSQSLYNSSEQFKRPLLLPVHQPSPLRLARSLSHDSPSQLKDDIFGCDDKNLIGDKTKLCCLPLVDKAQHQDLKSISPETLSKVLDGEFSEVIDEVIIVDCRYPYEYKGGHIKTAINIYTKEDIIEEFLQKLKCCPNKRNIVVFHCEFSSKRGPTLCRFLRNKDRDVHRNCYPKLYYPELYLLEGGYKAFFADKKEYCEPQAYLKMVDENYAQDLKHFTKRSKSWSEGSTRMRCGLRY